MNCDEFRSEWMESYLDREIEPDVRERVESHLGECPACRSEYEVLRTVALEARELPRELVPDRDLWPGIVERIGEGASRFGGARRVSRAGVLIRGAAAAAVLVAAVIAGLFLGRSTVPTIEGRQPTSFMQASLAGSGEFDKAIAEYVRASQVLREALAKRQASMPDETARIVFDNLRIIDTAISRVHEALSRDPGNRDLEVLLVATYQQEIELLQRATQMSAKS